MTISNKRRDGNATPADIAEVAREFVTARLEALGVTEEHREAARARRAAREVQPHVSRTMPTYPPARTISDARRSPLVSIGEWLAGSLRTWSTAIGTLASTRSRTPKEPLLPVDLQMRHDAHQRRTERWYFREMRTVGFLAGAVAL